MIGANILLAWEKDCVAYHTKMATEHPGLYDWCKKQTGNRLEET